MARTSERLRLEARGDIATITGVIYLHSWIVFSSATLRSAAVATYVLLTPFLWTRCCAETISGIVYSNHHGVSSDASGMLRLAVNGSVLSVYYGLPVLPRAAPQICYDIGAIWSLETRIELKDRVMVGHARCSGEVDATVHNAWLLSRQYIATRKNPSPTLFSAGWRASPRFSGFIESGQGVDMSRSALVGDVGCIDILSNERTALRLRAGIDCYLTIKGRAVELRLTIRRASSGGLEIDEGEIRQIGPGYR